jgi:hypothetical protein
MTEPDLDFSLGEGDKNYREPEILPPPEEEPMPERVVPLGDYRAKRRKRPKKLTDEEITQGQDAILEHIELVIASLTFIGTKARSMKIHGVRVNNFSEGSWYYKVRSLMMGLNQTFEKAETSVLLLAGGVNVWRLLEHIAQEWCARHRIVFVPMNWRQREKAAMLTVMAHKKANNRSPLDYLGGYFYYLLYGRGNKKFNWNTFLNEDKIIEWIQADYERRYHKKDVGHYRYDSDKSLEVFNTRFLSAEQRGRGNKDVINAIAARHDNNPELAGDAEDH